MFIDPDPVVPTPSASTPALLRPPVVDDAVARAAPTAGTGVLEDDATVTIDRVEERLTIDKRMRDTGGVRVHKRVETETVTVDEMLAGEEIDIVRVTVDRPANGHVGPRQDGDTLIVPVIVERVVTRIERVVVEELHITRRHTARRHVEDVVLRKEVVSIERFGIDEADAQASATDAHTPSLFDER